MAKKTSSKSKKPVKGTKSSKPSKPRQQKKPEEKKKLLTISAAKGRPMLTWVGKKPLRQVTAFPAQHIETFAPTLPSPQLRVGAEEGVWKDWPSTYPKGGLLFHGDNKEVLAHLLANGFRSKVQLIYIDPPFDSGADYVRKIRLRGNTDKVKMGAETYTLGEQIQYTDIWANDNYLQFMYERLMMLKELLADDGTIYLHCDDTKSHLLRSLLDEIFGAKNFMNEVLWLFRERGISKTTWNSKHNNIFVYAKSIGQQVFNVDAVRDEYSEETKKKFKFHDDDGWYQIRGRNIPGSPIRQADGLRQEHEEQYPGLTYRQYMEDGQLPVDWWEIPLVNKAAKERTAYPTQKPEELLYKSVLASSSEGGLILDCFIGSGTTAAVAQKLGRRWIGCDINKGAIQTTSKRLQNIILEQANNGTQLSTSMEENEKQIAPAQLSFTVYRVNDYDLQIQHNEAVNLACEHIGVTRTKNDSFFDGTLGKRLVKIIPFGHPLNSVDLEELKKELKARPGEDRDIVVVALGKELSIEPWLEEWSRLRKQGDVPNKIEIIELRTDQKYGKFIKHEPAKARVKVERKKDMIQVVIEDFISPTILERLSTQNGLLQPQIKDWRSMVDCVMIDANYNGEVFNIQLSDVPEKKNDLVKGVYELDAPRSETTVAVKIVDMLGEEVVIVVNI